MVRALAVTTLLVFCAAITDDAGTADLQEVFGQPKQGGADIKRTVAHHGRLQCRRYFGCMLTDRAPLGFTQQWEEQIRVQR